MFFGYIIRQISDHVDKRPVKRRSQKKEDLLQKIERKVTQSFSVRFYSVLYLFLTKFTGICICFFVDYPQFFRYSIEHAVYITFFFKKGLSTMDELMVQVFCNQQQTYEVIAEMLGEDLIEEDE